MMLTVLAILGSSLLVPVRLNQQSMQCAGAVHAAPQVQGATEVTATLDDGRAMLAVPASGPWLVSLDSEKCWAAPVLINADAPVREVELVPWAKGEISGSVSVPSRQHVPRTLHVELRPAAARGRAPRGNPIGTVACAVVDRRWRCDAPITSLDVRIAADGFAPAYFWNLAFENGRAAVPPVSFQVGASLSGWVEDARGEPVSDVEVRLTPQHLSRATARISGLAAQTATVRSNDRGFFQFRGVSSGEYKVTVRTKTGAVAAAEMTIRDGREHVLPHALILESPASVVVQIEPPLSPDRQPWNVRLSRVLPADSATEPVATGRANELGTWHAEGVERGPYNIEVLDSAGSTVASLDADVDRDTAMLDIKIGNVRVEGRVRFGNEPIAGELRFFAAAGTMRLQSGADGLFAGWLPTEGAWNVQITPNEALQRVRTRVDVHVPSDKTRATVNIDLPGGRIEGIVLDEDGNAVPESEILVLRGAEMLANAATDPEGRFRVLGLAPGAVTVYAQKGELSSDYQQASVSAAVPSRETIVLRAAAELKGKLVHPSGAPVVGALIRYFRNDEMRKAVSGPTGEFTLELQSGVPFADLIVIAPRGPVVLDRVQIGRDDTVVVVPDTAAVLRITPQRSELPRISRRPGRLLGLSTLFAPQQEFDPPREYANGAIELRLAPGEYTVCYSSAADCVQFAANAGDVTRITPPHADGGK